MYACVYIVNIKYKKCFQFLILRTMVLKYEQNDIQTKNVKENYK